MLTIAIVAFVLAVLVLAILTIRDYIQNKAFGSLIEFLSSSSDEATATRQKVSYYSGKHGWRYGYSLGRDNSGRTIIDMGGYTVRRQPHLVRSVQ